KEGSFADSIERIRHQHRIVSLGHQSFGHVTHRWPETEGIGPDDDRGMRAGCRMNERGIARSVRSFDFDIHFEHSDLTRKLDPCSSSHTGSHCCRYEVAPGNLAVVHGKYLLRCPIS